jgi:hypothetical protein
MGHDSEDDDPHERAEYERALQHDAETRAVLPSGQVLARAPEGALRLLHHAGPALAMSPINVVDTFGHLDYSPFLWLGLELELAVQLSANGRPMGEPPAVLWSTSDPSVLAIRDTGERHNRSAVVTALKEGEAMVVAEVAGGLRRERAYTVRIEPEIQWF